MNEEEEENVNEEEEGMEFKEEKETTRLENIEVKVKYDAAEVKTSKPAEVECRGQSSTKLINTSCIIGSDGDGKDPARRSRTNNTQQHKKT